MTRNEAILLMQSYAKVARRPGGPDDDLLEHIVGMVERIPHIVGFSEKKAMRWLGFIQGVLVTLGVYSIDEVKEHSRAASHEGKFDL